MSYPTREQVQQVKEDYPVGVRVAVVSINDIYTHLLPGQQGTVYSVDDIGTVFVDWDNGSRLGAAYGVDEIRRV